MNNDDWTLCQTLDHAKDECQEYVKGVVLMLNDEDGNYDITRIVCGLDSRELITLLEAVKYHLLKEMFDDCSL